MADYSGNVFGVIVTLVNDEEISFEINGFGARTDFYNTLNAGKSYCIKVGDELVSFYATGIVSIKERTIR